MLRFVDGWDVSIDEFDASVVVVAVAVVVTSASRSPTSFCSVSICCSCVDSDPAAPTMHCMMQYKYSTKDKRGRDMRLEVSVQGGARILYACNF